MQLFRWHHKAYRFDYYSVIKLQLLQRHHCGKLIVCPLSNFRFFVWVPNATNMKKVVTKIPIDVSNSTHHLLIDWQKPNQLFKLNRTGNGREWHFVSNYDKLKKSAALTSAVSTVCHRPDTRVIQRALQNTSKKKIHFRLFRLSTICGVRQIIRRIVQFDFVFILFDIVYRKLGKNSVILFRTMIFRKK